MGDSTQVPYAFLICALPSWSAPTSTITTQPRYANSSTLLTPTLFTFISGVISEFIHNSFVFLKLIFSPAVAVQFP